MKTYRHIHGPDKARYNEFCYAFAKYDGSNIRAEWSPKRGWYKFGTRELMLDESHPHLGPAIPLFLKKYGDSLPEVFKKEFKKVQSVVVFFEFFGSKSFAGAHYPDDVYDVVLFDVSPHQQGILGPKQFLELFEHLPVAEVVYKGMFDQELIDSVRNETLDVGSKYPVKVEVPEGVICKGSSRHDLWMVKIKTNRYKQVLQERYQANWTRFWE